MGPSWRRPRRIRGVDVQNDVRSLFRREGERIEERMEFEAEMIIPRTGVDEFGQTATASVTFVRYHLILGWERP